MAVCAKAQQVRRTGRLEERTLVTEVLVDERPAKGGGGPPGWRTGAPHTKGGRRSTRKCCAGILRIFPWSQKGGGAALKPTQHSSRRRRSARCRLTERAEY